MRDRLMHGMCEILKISLILFLFPEFIDFKLILAWSNSIGYQYKNNNKKIAATEASSIQLRTFDGKRKFPKRKLQ